MKAFFARAIRPILVFFLCPAAGVAWDYEGHRLVNQLALATLPASFPAFVQRPEARERIAFLGGEPDRWRNTSDLPLKHFYSPDHFIDLEDLALYRLKPSTLSHFRYEFTAQLALARAANPRIFPPIAATNDLDRTKALIGFLPWTITEYYAKLKSTFSYLNAFEEYGTPEEIANARENAIFFMGVMGHFVGDGAQPLHTTRNFNGWVDPNPRRYTTNHNFHAWIDGGYFQKAGFLSPAGLQSRLRPAQMLWPDDPKAHHDDIFPEVMRFIVEQNKQVEPLYQLEKEGKLSGESEASLSGRAFLADQLIRAGRLLGDLWYTAWQQAPIDTYLRTHLLKRKNGNSQVPSRSSVGIPKSNNEN
ncbi:MAG: hypothetical protein DME19_09440 [Verrucomicrobia bacterium]|nr:MAG: hypothetical protein DME19_09440 [Verrucomicrobiota bacterium]